MDLSLLSTLQEKLVHGKDFKETFEYFFDRFADDDAFLKIGEKFRSHPVLEAILPALGKQYLGPDVKIAMPMFVRLPEHQFVHGACMLGGKMINFFYFEDIQHGLACIDAGGNQGTQFLRFSGRKLPAGYYSEN